MPSNTRGWHGPDGLAAGFTTEDTEYHREPGDGEPLLRSVDLDDVGPDDAPAVFLAIQHGN